MESIIGQILSDRYRIIKQLEPQSPVFDDVSDVNQVYLAEDLSSEGWGQCLIKRYQPQYSNEVLGDQSWQKVYQAFLVQGKILQQVSQHPQIPQLIDFFECDRKFYLAIEKIDGTNLKQLVADAPLNEESAISWLKEIANILEFLHQAGVAHHNLQPASLIQHRDGRKFLADLAVVERVILADFKTQQNSINPDLFPTNSGNKNDLQLDIYALGQTIFYALTAKYSQSSASKSLDYNNSSNNNIDSSAISNFLEHLSPKLTEVLQKMVSQDTAQCYLNTDQLIADLEFTPNVVTFPAPIFFGASSEAKPSSRSKVKFKQSNDKSTIATASKSKRKIQIAWLLFPLIIALTFIFISINRNSRSRFIKYVNDDYNFAIEYPQNWSQQELDDPITGEIVVFTSPPENDADLYLEQLSIAVEYLPDESVSLEKYTQSVIERINQTTKNDLKGHESYRANVDNSPASKVIYFRQEGELELKQMETFTVKNNQVYIAVYTAERDDFSKLSRDVLDMIESWKIK
ncbi:MAG: protein kinase [Cyanobacteria bacterium J06621_8]